MGNTLPAPALMPKPAIVLARIISSVLHPIFLPVLLCIVLYWLTPATFAPFKAPLVMGTHTLPQLPFRLASLSLLTIFFPLLSILLMKGLGFVKSIHMRDPKDRIIPLIATMTFFFWAYLVCSSPIKVVSIEGEKLIDVPVMVRIILLGAFYIIVAIFLVNIFFKVSMHATAAGGAIGFGLILLRTSPTNMLVPFFIFIVVAGIIGTARLILREHKPAEVWAGYALGFVMQMAAWLYLR